jgi:hypothetical protein
MPDSTKKGAIEAEEIGTTTKASAWKRTPVYWTFEEFKAMEARMHQQGKKKIGPYLKEVEAQQAEISAFKAEKARELAFELKRWQIPPELVLEIYRRM